MPPTPSSIRRWPLAAAAGLAAGAAVIAVVLANAASRPARATGGPPYAFLPPDELVEDGWIRASYAQSAPDLSGCITYVARAHAYGCVFRSNRLPDMYWASEFDLQMNIVYAQDIDDETAWRHRRAALECFDRALALDATNEEAWKGRGFLWAQTADRLLQTDWEPGEEGPQAGTETAADLARFESLIARLNAPAQADRAEAIRELRVAGEAAEAALIRHQRDRVLQIRQSAIGLLADLWRERAIHDSLRAWQCHAENQAPQMPANVDPADPRWRSDAGLNYLRLVRARGIAPDEQAQVAAVRATLSDDAKIRLDPPPPPPPPAAPPEYKIDWTVPNH